MAIAISRKWLYGPFIVSMLLLATSILTPAKVYYFIIQRGHAPEKEHDPTESINYNSYLLQKLVSKMRGDFEKFINKKIDELHNQSTDKAMHHITKRLISKKNTALWMDIFDQETRVLRKAVQNLIARGYSEENAMKEVENFANDLFIIRKNLINECVLNGDSSEKALSKALTIGYVDMVTNKSSLMGKYFNE